METASVITHIIRMDLDLQVSVKICFDFDTDLFTGFYDFIN